MGGGTYRVSQNPQHARQNYVTVKRSRGPIVQEMNYFDSALSAFQMTATTAWTAGAGGNQYDPTALPVAGINCLFAPTQGTAVNNRLGRKVYVHRIRIKGILYQPGLALGAGQTPGASPQQTVRLVFFLDKQTNAQQVAPISVMTTMAATSAAMICSFQNRDQVGRFQVFKDKTFQMPEPFVVYDNAGAAFQQGVTKTFKMNYYFKEPLCVNFNGISGGTIGDIVDNSFHLLGTCTSNGIGAATAPQLTYQCRTYFKE